MSWSQKLLVGGKRCGTLLARGRRVLPGRTNTAWRPVTSCWANSREYIHGCALIGVVCNERTVGMHVYPHGTVRYNIYAVGINCTVCLLGRLYSTGQGSSAGDDVDQGLRLGDYPVLPWRSAQLNKQTGWWDNQDRRDKETPVSAVRSGEYVVGRGGIHSLCSYMKKMMH